MYLYDSLTDLYSIKYEFDWFRHCQLRTRRALSIFKDVPLRTRRALSLHNVNGDCALLMVLNGTSLKSDSTLLALNWWCADLQVYWFTCYIIINDQKKNLLSTCTCCVHVHMFAPGGLKFLVPIMLHCIKIMWIFFSEILPSENHRDLSWTSL